MNIHDTKLIFEAAYWTDDAVLMSGLHGIGKSDVVKQFATDNGFYITVLFLSHQEVGDLIGMPRTIERNGEMIHTWTKPVWLQRMEEYAKKGYKLLLFLDELNRAPIDVRQSALQLVLEKQIHEHILPIDKHGKRCLIVAAINPSDEYQTDELDLALLDRFLNLEVEVDVPTWLNWARENKVASAVRDYITENPSKLHHISGSTPRSWAKLGQYVDIMDQIDGKVQFPIIKGKIGQEIGSQFVSYLKNYSNVIKIEDVETLVNKIIELNPNASMEELGEAIAELMEKSEPVQKKEMTSALMDKYFKDDNPNAEEVLPFIGLLYSLGLEQLNAFLKTLRTDKPNYKKLTKIDDQLNNKALFLKVVDLRIDD